MRGGSPGCDWSTSGASAAASSIPLLGHRTDSAPSALTKAPPLLGEYMSEQLLLRLPHRQFVFTPWSGHCTDLPKVLRVFFRHYKKLHGEISRLIYRLVHEFATAAAGRPIRTAAVVVLQT